MKQPKEIMIECTRIDELNSKAASLSKLSDLSEKTLQFLSGLDLPAVDKKLSNPLNQMALKGLVR